MSGETGSIVELSFLMNCGISISREVRGQADASFRVRRGPSHFSIAP